VLICKDKFETLMYEVKHLKKIHQFFNFVINYLYFKVQKIMEYQLFKLDNFNF